MIITVDKKGTVEEFNKAIHNVLKNKSVKGLLILACYSNEFTPANIDKHLKNINAPIFGGIFPQIIFGNENLNMGPLLRDFLKNPMFILSTT